MRSINTSKLSVKTHTKEFSSHDILLHPSLLPPASTHVGHPSQSNEKAQDSDSISIVEVKQNSNIVYIRLKQTEPVRGIQHISILNECFQQTGLQQMKPCQMRFVRVEHAALDHVRISFKDQFISRSDMWPFTRQLLNESVYIGKRLEYRGMRCTVKQLMKNQKHVRSGVISANTKISFRTQSGVTYLLIEISKEMWEYASDGDIFWERAINGFCRDLFTKWNANRATHALQILFYGRYNVVTINQNSETIKKKLESLLGPGCILKFDSNRTFIDFFQCLDNKMISYSNVNTLVSTMKGSFLEFHDNIQNIAKNASVKLNVVKSPDSNFLEAMNIVLAAHESHHVNRDLHHTGQYFIVLSAGVGVYNIYNSTLASLSKKRIGDNGIGVDMICFSYPPLHHIPLFLHIQKSNHGDIVYKSPDWLNVYFYDQKSYKDSQDSAKNSQTEHGDPIKIMTTVQVNTDNIGEEGIFLSSAPEYLMIPSADKFIPTSRMPSLRDRPPDFRKKLPLPSIDKNYYLQPSGSKISFQDHDDKIFDLNSKMHISSSNFNLAERESIKTSKGISSASYGKRMRSTYSDRQDKIEKQERRLKRSVTMNEGIRIDERFIVHEIPISFNQNTEEEFISTNNIYTSSSLDSKKIHHSPAHSRILSVNSQSSYIEQSYISNYSPVRKINAKSFYPFNNTYQNPMTVHLEAQKKPSLHQKRWAHLFPSDNYRIKTNDAIALLPNWLSLVEPACLPMTTFFWPDSATLLSKYNQSDYQVSVDENYNNLTLMKELICQRLHQGYQLYYPNNDPLNPSNHYYLSLSDQFQEIYIDEYNSVTVKRYIKKIPNKQIEKETLLPIRNSEIEAEEILSLHSSEGDYDPIEKIVYRYLMWNNLESKFIRTDMEFKGNPPDEYKWNQLDNIVIGYVEYLPLNLSPRCIHFHLVPNGDTQSLSGGSRNAHTNGKNPLLQQLASFLPTLTNRILVPCNTESQLDIKLIDPDNNPSDFISNRKSTTQGIKLESKGERYEWIYLYAKNSYYPGESYFFHIDWLVCSAVTIESYILALQRKAKQCGFEMYSTLIDSGWNNYSNPFRSFSKIELPKKDENKLKVLNSLCKEPFQFYSDILPISLHSKRFVHQTGNIIVHTDMNTIWWLENKISPNYNMESVIAIKKLFEQFKSLCKDAVTEEISKLSSPMPTPEKIINLTPGISDEEKIKLIESIKVLEIQESFQHWLKRVYTINEGWKRSHRILKTSKSNPAGREYKKAFQSIEKLLDSIRHLKRDFGIDPDCLMHCTEFIQEDIHFNILINYLAFMIKDIKKWESRRNKAKNILESIHLIRRERDIKKKTAKRKAIELQSPSIKANESDFKRISADFERLLNDFKLMQIDVERKLLELQALKQFDLLVEAQAIVLPIVEVSQDSIQELKRSLIEWNIWIKRDFRSYPQGNIWRDKFIQTLNPCSERVLLHRILISNFELNDQTWEHLIRVINLQKFTFTLKLIGAFTQKLSDGIYLFLEYENIDHENALNWVRNTEDIQLNIDELRQRSTKRNSYEIISLISKIATAISEIHSCGLEHNHFSTDTVFVNSIGDIKFIDFGNRFLINSSERSIYIAPESIFKKFGARDVYSLGVVFFELLSIASHCSILNTLDLFDISLISEQSISETWISNLILQMLDPNPMKRPTSSEVAAILRQHIITQDIVSENLSDTLFPNCSILETQNLLHMSQIENLKEIPEDHWVQTISISNNSQIVEKLNSYFLKLESFKDIATYLQIENGDSSSFHEICALYVSEISQIGKYFDIIDGYYIVSDDIELKTELNAIGRFLFYCCLHNIPLNISFHPLIYKVLCGNIPTEDNDILDLLISSGITFHDSNSSLKHIISLIFCLNSRYKVPMSSSILVELSDSIKKEKKILFGFKHRMKNLVHLQKGFQYFIVQSVKEQLISFSFIDSLIFIRGQNTISAQTILSLIGKSLSDKSWQESEESIRTRQWFVDWVHLQTNTILQYLLYFITGSSFIPEVSVGYTLELVPFTKSILNPDIKNQLQIFTIRSSCFNRLYIGTWSPSREHFFQALTSTLR